MSKRITNVDGQILSVKGTNIGIQRSLKDMNSKIVKVNKVSDSIKNSLKAIPSKRELREHAAIMGDQFVHVRELNTGLTMAMDGYNFRNLPDIISNHSLRRPVLPLRYIQRGSAILVAIHPV